MGGGPVGEERSRGRTVVVGSDLSRSATAAASKRGEEMPRGAVDRRTGPLRGHRRAGRDEWPELEELGFTHMEAAVYAHLLAHPPATGYAVAKALGKPTAYVYRAVESLIRQGAVLVDDSRTRLCRAVPFEELLDRLKRRFELQCVRAEARVSQLVPPAADDRIYRLATADQVFERCRAMLESAREVAFLVLFPEPLARLQDEIVAAARRKVRIALQVCEPVDLPVAWTSVFATGRLVKGWPRQWARLTVDGSEYVIALLTQDGRKVYQAVWSASPVLAYLQARSLGSEILLESIQALLESGASAATMRSELKRWQKTFHWRLPPGADKMAKLFAIPPEG